MKQTFSIQEPVGAGEINRARDLEATRNALAERRLCRRSVTGQTSATYRPDLAAGIRIFQRQVGLEPDGLVVPGGPTAMALAFGGEVPVVSAPTEGKLADDAILQTIEQDIAEAKRDLRDASILPEGKQASSETCADWREQIARAKRGIDAADRRIDLLNSLIQELEGDLRVARAKLQESLIQELENELRVANSKLKETEKQRLNLVKAMSVIQARVDRQCI